VRSQEHPRSQERLRSQEYPRSKKGALFAISKAIRNIDSVIKRPQELCIANIIGLTSNARGNFFYVACPHVLIRGL
jgi:nitrous oxidase accessory protein NosD